jgi:hypothetical protein
MVPGPKRHTVYPKSLAIGGISVAVAVVVGGKSVEVLIKVGVVVSVSVGGSIVAVSVGVIGEGLNVGEVTKVAVEIFLRFSALDSGVDW